MDHRKRPRRRGAALEAVILEAALAALTRVGYADLRVERVADRAGASKASLYRRWLSKVELVMDAVYHVLPDPTFCGRPQRRRAPRRVPVVAGDRAHPRGPARHPRALAARVGPELDVRPRVVLYSEPIHYPRLRPARARHARSSCRPEQGARRWSTPRTWPRSATAALLDPAAHRQRTWTPTGPEALTYTQVAAVLGDVLGRPVRYTRPSVRRYWRHARTHLHMGPGFAVVTTVIYTNARLGLAAVFTDDVREVTGRAPTPLRVFVERERAAWIPSSPGEGSRS